MTPHFQEWCNRLGITLSPEQTWAMAWLEKHGKRFLYDFGTDNCIELAEAWPIGPTH